MLKIIRVILKEIISKRDFSFLMFSLSLFLLPISINLSTFTFLASLLLKMVQVLLKRNKLFSTKGLKNSSIVGLVFFIYIIVNSVIQVGFEITIVHFEKSYAHYALFFLTPFLLRSKKENKLLLFSFFLGSVIAVMYVFFYAIATKTTYNRQAFLNTLDIHHTYLSMYLLAFINFTMLLLISKFKKLKETIKLGLFLVILVYLGVMFILGSKVSMLIILLLFIVHAFPVVSKNNVPIYAAAFMVLLTIVFSFSQQLNVSYEKALDFRLQIWEVSYNTFESSPFFGNLSSPEKDILNYKHYLNGKYYFLDSDLNSHNQYLSILMKFGLIGFSILFFYLVNVYKKVSERTSKTSIKEFLGFLVIALSVCYIENVFDRHHGIVYITFFYNYYLVEIENNEN
ncbi:O-antigen ligase family protein [Hanstruepera marina]|uniref:O-antigen ligase family protein n=1 Tax=Hanstruepera marina TaxID=2873265 RepID=UPI001CA6D16D|nr:O-antigen ligase family protein [Hanstruepera marina]